MGFAFTNPDDDRQLSIVSAYPFIHTTVPTDIRMEGDSIDIQMLVEFPVPPITTLDRN